MKKVFYSIVLSIVCWYSQPTKAYIYTVTNKTGYNVDVILDLACAKARLSTSIKANTTQPIELKPTDRHQDGCCLEKVVVNDRAFIDFGILPKCGNKVVTITNLEDMTLQVGADIYKNGDWWDYA